MGLFRKKQTAEPVQEKPIEPLDKNNWHEWAAIGNKYLEKPNFARAVVSWCEAIEHFDGDDAAYKRLHDDIVRQICKHLRTNATGGAVAPAQIIMELDVSAMESHPEFANHLYALDVFYYMKEHISEATTAVEMSIMFIQAAYCIEGYLRFSTDLRASADKCEEVYRLGGFAWENCTKINRSQRSDVKSKVGIQFIVNIGQYFEKLCNALRDIAETLSPQEHIELVEYRKAHLVDRMEHLGMGLRYAIRSEGPRHMNKKKAQDGIEQEVAAYIEDFLRKD